MGYPKQPGQDAEAHRRVTEKTLALSERVKDLEAENAKLRQVLDNARPVPYGLLITAQDVELGGASRQNLAAAQSDPPTHTAEIARLRGLLESEVRDAFNAGFDGRVRYRNWNVDEYLAQRRKAWEGK
jgi:hypothetical protein